MKLKDLLNEAVSKESKTKDEIKKVILGMYYMGNFDWQKLGLDK